MAPSPPTTCTALVMLAMLACLLGSTPGQERGPDPHAEFDFEARRASHWAWQPLATPVPPELPAVPDVPELAVPGETKRTAARAELGAVDRFVQARLRAVGLAPSPPAAPHVLLRRLWFDLVGLPPPADVVASFVADPSEAAYDRQVDELLASSHFGERWARHWLDLVRYAETLGHEFDFPLPNAWRYRDYVIRALNADLPYDQFVREHIAGDLIEPPRRAADGSNQSVQATAAWWFGEQAHSPVDARQHHADRIDNQIDVLGKAVLGLTVACARCHDHKFDAIRTADYYALAGFVASSRYVQAPIRPVDVHGTDYAAALEAQHELARTWAAHGALQPGSAWSALAASSPEQWSPASGVTLRAEDRTLAAADGPRSDWIVGNDGFGPEPWQGAWCANPGAEAPELRLLPGAFWHSGIAGLSREGVLQTRTFSLDARYVHVRAAGQHSRMQLVVDGLNLVRDPIYGELHREVREPAAHWLTFDTAAWSGRPAHLQCLDQHAPDLSRPDDATHPDSAWLAVQMVVLSPHATPPPTAAALELPPAAWPNLPDAVRSALAELQATAARLPVSPTVPSLGDGTGADEHVFVRGDPRQQGPLIARRFLEALAGPAALAVGPGSGRLALADAVLAAQHPLARVLTNRLWHHLFGRGLVRSADNFGALGDKPSHPELLDWLARDFLAHGWSLKHTLRALLRSHAYRQDSRERPEGCVADPDNVLLHRQNVRRLEAEAVRDSLLVVAGRLDATLFGQPVPIPLDGHHEARGKPKQSGPLDGDGRRSIYLAVQRNFLSPMLLAFDLPTPFATVGARNVSNVPAQSLAMANDPFVHAMCKQFAERMLASDAASCRQRLTLAYTVAFARAPTATELARCEPFLATAAASYGTSTDDVRPWTDLLHALVNTTEFTFRR